MSTVIANTKFMGPMDLFKWFIDKAKLISMPYQYDAVEWMVNKELKKNIKKDEATASATASIEFKCNVRGGILADEMGLGKTIMMLGLFIANFVNKTLIVVPAPLVNQWASEMLKHCGHKILIWNKNVSLEALASSSFVIITYNKIATIGTDNTSYGHKEFMNVVWDRIVFDEAHNMRNKNRRFIAARGLKARVKWLITGTPIQNRRNDFWNLCSIIGLPASYYTSSSFKDDLLQKYYLRRTKVQVGIMIPTMTLCKKNVEWSNENEMKLSNDIHRAYKRCHREDKLRLLISARQVCILPKMVAGRINSLTKSPAYLKKEEEPMYIDGSNMTSKIDEVIRVLVERKDNGSGKLIFCHFRQEIDIIVLRLKAAGFESVATFDGRVSVKERAQIIEDGAGVLILQIQTGCEGINLQDKYSEVYFVSPSWNPAIEDQAVARCHRIGQKREVNVFKFGSSITKATNTKEKAKAKAKEGDKSKGGEVKKDEDEDEDIPSLDDYINSVQNSKREIRKDILSIDE